MEFLQKPVEEGKDMKMEQNSRHDEEDSYQDAMGKDNVYFFNFPEYSVVN